MDNILIRAGKIITVNRNTDILSDYIIAISGNIITDLYPFKTEQTKNYLDFSHLTLIPGFVQTHIHLCQTLFRGLADDLFLLDWLQYRIFPFENAHSPESMQISTQLGINDLLLGGTTTLLDMGSLNHQEVVFEELISSGIRAFAGKCMIDSNELFPEFKASSNRELSYSYDLAKKYHNSANERIKYGFAPRFVLSCTEKLLKDTKDLMADFPGSIYHTHSSENKDEVELVKKMYGKENIEYFDSINVLDKQTVLAHCIHTNDKEIGTLKNTGTNVAHCPSSNLKLGSGIADIPRYLNEGISVSLGADGAPCNNNLSMFNEMRLASLIQKPIYNPTVMNAKTVFKLATIDGAKALNLENEIGSIEVGKKADLVFLNLNKANLPLSPSDDDLYSKIVYSASNSEVDSVMIDGKWGVRGGVSLVYDNNELIRRGNEELNILLKRVGK